MGTKVISKDNGYFEVVELDCCGDRVRIDTEFIQYGITASKRESNRKATLRNHVCKARS